jgi:DNA helicase-2/ATP-dependent DNA helicase PcrA
MAPYADGLTESQLRAVTHPGGPLMVLGGAGTGKTTVLERRLSWLTEQGADPSSLLAITLSPSAAGAMRVRVEELVAPPYDELHVHTFREFCTRLLRDEAVEAGMDPAFAPVSPADRVALLLDQLSALSLRHHEIRGNPAPLLAGFVSRIDRLKQDMVGPEELLAQTERLTAEGEGDDAARIHAAREHEFARVYADHDRMLTERGALDTGDLVLRAFRLLHERPHVRRRTAERYAHVLVDDHQDLDFAQSTLLGLLCEERREVTVAGDPDQALPGPGPGPGGRARRNLDDFRRGFHGCATVQLEQSRRCPRAVAEAAWAVIAPLAEAGPMPDTLDGGTVSFWRCASERAQAQAVAARAERLVGEGADPARIGVLVRSTVDEGAVVCSALEERAVPFRMSGAAAYFQRAEVRDVLAWLRLLAQPSDSGAAVRALARAPVGLHSVDIARLTQLARRRKLDMPAAVAAALEGPQLTPEGRDRAQTFLRIYRPAAAAFEDRRPDAFVLRLIERIGIRRQQVFATQADTVERLRNIAQLPDLARDFMRREPGATPRDFARYLRSVADSGLDRDQPVAPAARPAVQVMAMEDARGLDFDHVFVVGVTAGAMPGRDADGEGMRHLLHLAFARAREELVVAWPEEAGGAPARPSPFVEEARAALGAQEEHQEEELFGPGEGLHSAFRIMRDELLDTVARVGGRLGEMRLDTGVDVSHAMARFLELIKVAAVIDRSQDGQKLDEAIAEVNALLGQGATSEQREILAASPLDDWLRDAGRDPSQRPAGDANGTEPSLDPFIPRRRGAGEEGLMLSASDIETYRLCPLKYKFARVFRIPQEPTIHQRFGIVLHQVLERFHKQPSASHEDLMDLFDVSWRRSGFGDSDDELQFRERAVDALDRYWESSRQEGGEPVWFERSFSFQLGPHILRGRVDRVDRHPDGSYELIDYKTGKSKTEEELSQDIQLSVYQMGARESWELETSGQSYYYVMTGEKVPVEHSEDELKRVRRTVAEIGDGILRQEFQPTPSHEICSFCDYRIICPAAER